MNPFSKGLWPYELTWPYEDSAALASIGARHGDWFLPFYNALSFRYFVAKVGNIISSSFHYFGTKSRFISFCCTFALKKQKSIKCEMVLISHHIGIVATIGIFSRAISRKHPKAKGVCFTTWYYGNCREQWSPLKKKSF